MSFVMPETREELLKALGEKSDALFCAGGTDLMIRLREKKIFHYSLIDLTHLTELREISEEEELIRIGSAVTMDELERSPVIRQFLPALVKAASMVGSTQIRNRATVGGNVANASQSSDLTPVLMAYEALAEVLDETGTVRRFTLDEIVKGLGKTSLKDTDVILAFLIRKSDALSGFAKVGSRKAVAISKVNVCVKAEVRNGKAEHVSVLLGAVGPKARRSPLIEQAMEGKVLDTLTEDPALKDAVYAQIEENIPDRSSKHYKKPAAYGILCDAIDQLAVQNGSRMDKEADDDGKGGNGCE